MGVEIVDTYEAAKARLKVKPKRYQSDIEVINDHLLSALTE